MADTKRLTRDWIQFLKSNQIVALNSDPTTGKLAYKKKVTADDLSRFLETKTDFDEETINNAIQTVLSKKGTPRLPDKTDEPKPGKAPTPNPPAPGTPPKSGEPPTPGTPQSKKYNTDDATDVEVKSPRPGLPAPQPKEDPAKTANKQEMMQLTKGQGLTRNDDGTLGVTIDDPEDPSGNTSLNLTYDDNYNIVGKKKYRNVPDEDTPTTSHRQHTGGKLAGQQSQTRNAINKRNARTKPGDQMQLVEEFTDKPIELEEKDVEDVFALLYPTEAPEDKKQADLDKLKDLVKTKMSASQRKELWRALNESVLFEEYVDKDDVRELFKYATKLKGNKIDIEDLRLAWKKAGYPSDTNDIAAILQRAGFGNNEIDRVFNEVLGEYKDEGDDEEYVDDEEDTPPSPAIIKIAEYVKKNGIKDELVAFLQKEFGKELSEPEEPAPEPKKSMFDRAKEFGKKMFSRKATTEEVRQIFTNILKEERTMLSARIKEQEQRLLGRSRK
jgi:hypothetical protein